MTFLNFEKCQKPFNKSVSSMIIKFNYSDTDILSFRIATLYRMSFYGSESMTIKIDGFLF